MYINLATAKRRVKKILESDPDKVAMCHYVEKHEDGKRPECVVPGCP